MSAALLRAAADRLDGLAGAATPGPWVMWNGWGPSSTDGLMRCERLGPVGKGGLIPSSGVDIAGSRGDFEYIAALSPEVGKALAAWLREAADDHELRFQHAMCDERALAVARLIVGGDQ